ncbi:hypothetical protein [Pararhizobium gei]|uniref:hypothetical protein n=1 Tax=Pararhizobium gei TaxID=1395951 RepID=UPI0023DAC465|nr:hypothetical protein [Rhizobium gei]
MLNLPTYFRRRPVRFIPMVLSALLLVHVPDRGGAASEQHVTATIPAPLVGPYIIDPTTLAELDQQDGDCAKAGSLNFQCLVFKDDRSMMKEEDFASNPFQLSVFDEVRKTVKADLESLPKHTEFGGGNAKSLDIGFLTYAGARIELVGVINRMDRQFNRDRVDGRGERLECGEISAIYRFAYEGRLPSTAIGTRDYRSRLPVTMNVVFPARPWSKAISCQDVARRWLDYADGLKNGTPTGDLVKQAKLLVSVLKPEDIERIELNMQGSRVAAGADITDFGTLGTYIIRVFRWTQGENGGRWKPSYMTNQIDRARLLGKPFDDNTCEDKRGLKISRQALVEYLLSKNAIGDVDNGLLNIPQEFLACRAISISPGGASRSGNQPFWDAPVKAEQIIDNKEIDAALKKYDDDYTLGYVGSALEFRTRLNEASCSGCHQTRAIAGFHFPGADRPDTSPVNAVFLPGSAHFFGDQLRRIKILEKIASGEVPTFPDLATSYAARPLNSYEALKPDPASARAADLDIQLIGGWGATCLMDGVAPKGVRQWGCAKHLACKPVFQSDNQLGIGICSSPDGGAKIGDPMQVGKVVSRIFGIEKYFRDPKVPGPKDGMPRDTTISTEHVTPAAPLGNSYVASHQEAYEGIGGLDPMKIKVGSKTRMETAEEHARRVREQATGGFPAGALRLSECVGLPEEATCGLLAASGFNPCLDEVGEGRRTPDNCFGIYTNYSGVRACDAAHPCRDDYICLSPMGYSPDNAKTKFDERAKRRKDARMSVKETAANRKRLAINFFGEKMPDNAWLGSNEGAGDQRGLCIPPYFVFQFKADGHKVPKEFVPEP